MRKKTTEHYLQPWISCLRPWVPDHKNVVLLGNLSCINLCSIAFWQESRAPCVTCMNINFLNQCQYWIFFAFMISLNWNYSINQEWLPGQWHWVLSPSLSSFLLNSNFYLRLQIEQVLGPSFGQCVYFLPKKLVFGLRWALAHYVLMPANEDQPRPAKIGPSFAQQTLSLKQQSILSKIIQKDIEKITNMQKLVP